jgi:hypothetical protein
MLIQSHSFLPIVTIANLYISDDYEIQLRESRARERSQLSTIIILRLSFWLDKTAIKYGLT